MADLPPNSKADPLFQALGRVPSGLFILTARRGDRPDGLLASWVQQAGFEPPMLTVALRSDRELTGGIVAVGRFTLNQVAAGQKHLIRHFARGFEPEAPAFEGIDLRDQEDGDGNNASGAVLAEALAFLRCEVTGDLAGGDHRILLARVVAGGLLAADAEPMVHIRKNGAHY